MVKLNVAGGKKSNSLADACGVKDSDLEELIDKLKELLIVNHGGLQASDITKILLADGIEDNVLWFLCALGIKELTKSIAMWCIDEILGGRTGEL